MSYKHKIKKGFNFVGRETKVSPTTPSFLLGFFECPKGIFIYHSLTLYSRYAIQTPDSHFVLRLFDKGENDFKDNKTIDSVPPMSPPYGWAGRVAQISMNYCPGKELRPSL